MTAPEDCTWRENREPCENGHVTMSMGFRPPLRVENLTAFTGTAGAVMRDAVVGIVVSEDDKGKRVELMAHGVPPRRPAGQTPRPPALRSGPGGPIPGIFPLDPAVARRATRDKGVGRC